MSRITRHTNTCTRHRLAVPDMAFAVRLGGEGELADETLEGALAVVRAQVPDQRALVGARVATHVTLVGGQAEVGAHVACRRD